MVFDGGVSALGAAKNAAYVTRAVSEAISAAKSTEVESSTLFQQLRAEVFARTVYSYGKKDVDYAEKKYASSPVYAKLVRAHESLIVADSTSRIIYNPPSSGKTSAAKMFMKKVLGNVSNPSPGLMFTGVSAVNNYFESITDCFPDHQSDPATVFKCVISALSRSSTAKQRSPWLILDEFNLPGEDNINLKFAETLFRQVSEEKLNFNILFITQKEEMANELLSYNCWQKISPLPGFTSPDSTTVLHAEQVPKDFSWVKMPWTRRQLSMVVFLKFPELLNDGNSIEEEEGGLVVYKPLTGAESPTGAIKLAAERMGIQGDSGEASTKEHNDLIQENAGAKEYL